MHEVDKGSPGKTVIVDMDTFNVSDFTRVPGYKKREGTIIHEYDCKADETQDIVGNIPAVSGLSPHMNRYEPKPYVKLTHPEWCHNATIYQINTRQFTPQGSIRAATGELNRLKALGVKILWLMPIHEIGQQNRKGALGSPYAVRDYYSVSTELGTLEDLKTFVARAHSLGMYVILDWVANHTAWDNPLSEEHPDWYTRDWKGSFRSTPWFDWADIIDLDYNKAALRQYMTCAMKYWVETADIDGFRCDVAGHVPLDFWENLRDELDEIKPVFMLAECEGRDFHARAFDMTYAWSWTGMMKTVAAGNSGLEGLNHYYATHGGTFPREAMRMLCLTNHDMNAWEGTEFELFGDALDAITVLAFVSEGMPLIYNGQEAGNTKRLKFFERDSIIWQEHYRGALLTRLVALKRSNKALHNGHWGAQMIQVANDRPDQVFSFVRQKEKHRILAVFNFSANPEQITLQDDLYAGDYYDFDSGDKINLPGDSMMQLQPWGHRLFVAQD